MISKRTSKLNSSCLGVHLARLLNLVSCLYFFACFSVWRFYRVVEVWLRHDLVGCRCGSTMKILLHLVPLHLMVFIVLSVIQYSCRDHLSSSIYHPFLGADVVKYGLILRGGVFYLKFLVGHVSALSLPLDGHFFTLIVHLMLIKLPRLELVRASCRGINLIMLLYFSGCSSLCFNLLYAL